LNIPYVVDFLTWWYIKVSTAIYKIVSILLGSYTSEFKIDGSFIDITQRRGV
jgi:hypothetical protein